jgi:hypothetical protein
VASKYDFKGPGVTKPHPRKNWFNPDAHPVHGPDVGRGWGAGSVPSGPATEGSGRSPLLLFGLIGVVVLVAVVLLVVFVLL